jgi:hypothetical protein
VKICPRCGAQYPDSYLLCKDDGFPLRDGAAEAVIPPPEKALVGEDETTAVREVESARTDRSTDVAGPPSLIEAAPTNVVVKEDSRFRQDEDNLEPEKALPGTSAAEADEGPTDVVDHDEPTMVDHGVIESVLAKMRQEAAAAKDEAEDEVPIRSVPQRLPPVRKPNMILSKPEPGPEKARPKKLEAKLEKLEVKPQPPAVVSSISGDAVALQEEAPAPVPESPVAAPGAPSPLAAQPERQTPFGPASRLAAAAAAEPPAAKLQLTAEVEYSYAPQPLGRKHLVLWGVSVVTAILITAVVVWSLARSDNAAQERPALAAAALAAHQRVVAADAAVVPNANVVPDVAVVRDSASVPDAAVSDAAAPPDAAAPNRSRLQRRHRRQPRRTSRRTGRRRGPRPKPKPKKKDGVFQRTVDPFAE